MVTITNPQQILDLYGIPESAYAHLAQYSITDDVDELQSGTEGADILAPIMLLWSETYFGQGYGYSTEIYGNGGDDTYQSGDWAEPEFVTVYGGAGNDSLAEYHSLWEWVSGIEIFFYGESGNDTLRAKSCNYVTMDGGAGDDRLSLLAAVEGHIYGGAGNDTLSLNDFNESDVVYIGSYLSAKGGQGNDIIYVTAAYGETLSAYGDEGNDSIYVSALADSYDLYSYRIRGVYVDAYGGAGNDYVSFDRASLPNNAALGLLSGGAGTDHFSIGSRWWSDYVTAYYTDNLVNRYEITDYEAGEVVDFALGYGAIDEDSGDVLYNVTHEFTLADLMRDSMDGVFDRLNDPEHRFSVSLVETTAGLVMHYGDEDYGTVTFRGMTYDLLLGLSINGFVGTEDADLFDSARLSLDGQLSPAASNRVYGFGGDDTIYLYGGNDTAFGGDGDDTLYGQRGDDRLYGGDDSDLLFGGEGNDVLRGEHGADRLYGQAGDDALGDWSGASLLDGGLGNDWLSGGAGDDTLLGGDGDDTLLGGRGADTLTGNNGADVFSFLAASEVGAVDLITDFSADQDIIRIADAQDWSRDVTALGPNGGSVELTFTDPDSASSFGIVLRGISLADFSWDFVDFV